MCSLIKKIKNTKKFEKINSYYLFIGTEPYKDDKRESKQLILNEYNDSIYNFTNGKVAFIPQNHTYASSFLYLSKMIFDSFDFIVNLEKNNIPNENLAKFLHNKGYVFINPPDLKSSISDQELGELIKNAKHIIIIGDNDSDTYKKIIKSIQGNNKNATKLYHCSSNLSDYQRHTSEWIKHDNCFSEQINGDKINLQKLILL